MNQSTQISQVAVAESSFFTKVYQWMAGGLVVTALASVMTISYTPFLTALIRQPFLLLGLIIAELGLVIWLSARIMTMPLQQAMMMFLAYSALSGITLSPIFLIYTGASIASTFAITAGTFMIFSVYGYTTKKDLTSMGSLAVMGLIGFLIASVVNFFLKSPALYWIITYGLIAVFLGLIAYDTQKLKQIRIQLDPSGEQSSRIAIMGALTLYLDFINLFILLLRIFGRRR